MTFYTTKSAGSTIVIPITQDNTVVVTKSYTITSTFEPPTTKYTVTNMITEQETVPVYEVTTIRECYPWSQFERHPNYFAASERTSTAIGTTEVEVVETVKSTAVVDVPVTVTADRKSVV